MTGVVPWAPPGWNYDASLSAWAAFAPGPAAPRGGAVPLPFSGSAVPPRAATAAGPVSSTLCRNTYDLGRTMGRCTLAGGIARTGIAGPSARGPNRLDSHGIGEHASGWNFTWFGVVESQRLDGLVTGSSLCFIVGGVIQHEHSDGNSAACTEGQEVPHRPAPSRPQPGPRLPPCALTRCPFSWSCMHQGSGSPRRPAPSEPPTRSCLPPCALTKRPPHGPAVLPGSNVPVLTRAC